MAGTNKKALRDANGRGKTAAKAPRNRAPRAGTTGHRAKAQGVLDQLGQQVVSGHYRPGHRLPTETDLARKLKVSKPSLREGLKALSRKGLLESRTRRGTTVLGKECWDILDPDVLRWMAKAPPDPEFLLGLLEARKILEPAASRLAAMRASHAQIVQIEQAFRGMADSLPHDLETCCTHDLAFHESIFAATGNAFLHRFAIAIRAGLLTLMRVSSDMRETYENSLAEHLAVAVAIRKRDPDEAEQAMRALLAGTSRDLAPALRVLSSDGRLPRIEKRSVRGRRTKPPTHGPASNSKVKQQPPPGRTT